MTRPKSIVQTTNVKGAFVLLIDNSEKTLAYATLALTQLHNYYNSLYHYPLVVFYEKGFPDSHKRRIENIHFGKVTFVLVDLTIVHNVAPEDLPTSIPGFEKRTTSIGYRSMCRYVGFLSLRSLINTQQILFWRYLQKSCVG